MNATQALNRAGQSLWLDNITRELLDSGTLQRYIDDFAVTGLISNPTIFDQAIKDSRVYDADIARQAAAARPAEEIFFELALADLTRAGIDTAALATRLQDEGAAAFVRSWNELMAHIGTRGAAIGKAG